MNERRRTHRARTLLGGVIAFNDRRSTIECRVRNLSAAGARVHFNNTALLPDEFDLTIPLRDLTWRVRMIWRCRDGVGACFLDEAESSVLPLDVAQRLKVLETRNKALKRRIAELSESGI